MDNLSTLFSGYLLTSAMIILFMVLHLLTSNKSALARIFSALCLCIAIYSFGYGMELHTAEMDHMLFWNLVQYAGIPFLPAFWLFLAIRYTKPDKFHGLLPKVFLFLIPSVTFLLRYTNEIHHLYYSFVFYVKKSPFPTLFIDKGPWYLVQVVYSTAAILVASYLYLEKSVRHPGIIRKQCLLMFCASVLPWASMILDLLNIAPYNIDYTPFLASFSFVLFLFVLYKYEFLDLKPLARDKAFESSDSGIVVLDPQFHIVDFNTRAAEVIPELKTGSFRGSEEGLTKENGLLMQEIRKPSGKPYEIRRNDQTCYFNISTQGIADKHGKPLGYNATLTDVTKYVESLKLLDYYASRDDLTGLLNRRFFTERSNYELDRARRYEHALSLIILDLDFFKNINDEFGHQAGDAMLKAVAKICEDNLRTTDLLGRMGGEEFLICLPETDTIGAMQTAERIRSGIEAMELPYENKRIKVTASIGVTGTDCVTDETFESFLRSADRALYAAKTDGRNCVRSELLRMIS